MNNFKDVELKELMKENEKLRELLTVSKMNSSMYSEYDPITYVKKIMSIILIGAFIIFLMVFVLIMGTNSCKI